MGLFPLPFDELHADAPTMRDAATLLAHAEADGWPQLWLHSDGRALVVTRAHRYVPTPEALATLRQKFEDSPRKDGAVSVYRLRDAKTTERNTLVSAERAQKLLDGRRTKARWMKANHLDEPRGLVSEDSRYDGRMSLLGLKDGVAIVAYEEDAALMAAAPDLGETVVALHAEVALRTSERDNAVVRCQQLARVLADAATPEDAVQLLSSVLVEDAANAPNCAEWRGSYSGRVFAITVQWVDGKSPHALIDEARSERDALRAETASAQVSYAILRTILTQGYTDATGDAKVAADAPLIDLARAVCDSLGTLRAERDAEAAGRDDLVRRLNLATETARQSDRRLYAIRAALDGMVVPPPGDSLARRLHEVIATHAGYAADLRDERNALRAIVDGRTTAPTDEEIETHCSRGGAWVVGHEDGGGMMIAHDVGLASEIARRHRTHPGMGWVWHALDATGRPCAWPVVTP